MSIERFFTKSVIIRRLSTVSGYKKAFVTTATVDGALQELDRRAREKLGIIEERAFMAWFPVDCIVQEGDTLVDEYGTSYHVTEVTKKDYGVNQHKQVVMQENNE